MTDDEIIKYMQCVIGNEMNCSECTYQRILPFPSCRNMCAKNALDLVNRQKATIKNLKAEIAEHKAMLEAFDNELVSFDKAIKTEKSEAIKEFAERLKSEYEDEKQGRYINWLMNDIIDNLVKEMTEVSE